MPNAVINLIYLIASVLFILSLGGLSNQESAKRGVWYGIVGMIIALIATVSAIEDGFAWLIPALVIGGAIGAVVAQRVEMTGMPQLVAALHSFVGVAAVFIGVVVVMDAALVAPFIERSWAMFQSPIGTWIPFAPCRRATCTRARGFGVEE